MAVGVLILATWRHSVLAGDTATFMLPVSGPDVGPCVVSFTLTRDVNGSKCGASRGFKPSTVKKSELPWGRGFKEDNQWADC